jgi:hypothetical protein
MDEPTISLKLSDYDKLRRGQRDLETRVAELERELTAAQLADPTQTLERVHTAFLAAMQVVQFGVANLPPESIVGWPHAALATLADAIDTLPGISRHLQEIAPELREFARGAAGLEAWRKERDKHRVVVPATAADYGPQTDEARAVHAGRSRVGDAVSAQAPTQPRVET